MLAVSARAPYVAAFSAPRGLVRRGVGRDRDLVTTSKSNGLPNTGATDAYSPSPRSFAISRILLVSNEGMGFSEAAPGTPMAPNSHLVHSSSGKNIGLPPELDKSFSRQAILSTALISVFRGKFCDLVLANRKATTFSKHSVIYDVGERSRTFFFLKSGFVKVGAILRMDAK